MSTVLVTGGTGVIGSWVTRRLLETGAKVVTFSRHPDITLIRNVVPDVAIATGDMLDLPSIVSTMKAHNVGRVIHMATTLIDPLEANPFMGYRGNVEGAMTIFEACRFMEVKRLVFISTKGVYAPAQGEYGNPICKPIDEDYAKAPMTVYGATKLFAENMALSYNRIYGLDVVVLRFSSTYGPGKGARHGYTALYSAIIEGALSGQPFRIAEDIDLKDDMVYVKDIAAAVVKACFAEGLQHRIFHIGSGRVETARRLIDVLILVLGSVPIEVVPRSVGAKTLNRLIYDISRARQELGYEPEYHLEKAVDDYIQTLRQVKNTV
ncbi:MAG: NAD(P)-dependent oxidoreductase [Chloroflexi bacterium]|nr:NAD(P)-dependent oxidoreductase [Chloroflexota bacterium]